MSGVRTYGFDPIKLADNLTSAELGRLMLQISEDPESKNPAHAAGRTIEIYTKKANKKMDAIALAVFYQKQEKQRAALTTTPEAN